MKFNKTSSECKAENAPALAIVQAESLGVCVNCIMINRISRITASLSRDAATVASVDDHETDYNFNLFTCNAAKKIIFPVWNTPHKRDERIRATAVVAHFRPNRQP